MKKLIFIAIFLVVSLCIEAQSKKNDSPAKASFQDTYISPDLSSLDEALGALSYKRAENERMIDILVLKVFALKKETDNTMFHRNIDIIYNDLKNTLKEKDVKVQADRIRDLKYQILEECDEFNRKVGDYAVSSSGHHYYKPAGKRAERGKTYPIYEFSPIYSEPTLTKDKLIKELEDGGYVTIVRKDGDFYYVKYKDLYGYMSHIHIKY